MNYPQLDAYALQLLENAILRFGSIKATAEHIGYTRSSVSLARSQKYPGDTYKMRRAILQNLSGIVACPYLQKDLSAKACADFCARSVPTSSRAEVKHWQACQACQFNPKNMRLKSERPTDERILA
ncbi:hypothetical protein [Bartonella sp. HY761]|uniref:hypothetical protein n=1 Tax=Bartonella sp. HY761 TaxID=2979330 RepID=UPI0021FEF5E8|nr:hypothetical protein [Bartonella sp. HY761]UXN07539.1 hypothetical protein N6A79_06015 [Bartonella sp. HY761]